ncbi:drug/metabolite transporter (DMT)-like permease [Peribacillus deserti]|uniref:Drug/metabolite transporter (DMT)-like permease n=1 Tax=Peribacillus deserti TaxID=673318 RepID=A0ABS2QD03_9BACI|nr:drug/metabolite transporter (DMT)-like permease [Peribacillus deserti]
MDSIWLVTLQLLIGGTCLISAGSAVESWTNINWEIPFIMNLLFISIFVIALGWLAFFTLVGSGEASKVGSFTFLIPIIAILFSTFLLNEAITIQLIIGLLLIVISICCVNINLRKQKSKS